MSIVTYPANPNATVSLRSRALLKTPNKLRDLYRSVGTRSKTRALLDNLTTDTTDEDLTALAVLLGTTHEGTRSHHSTDTQLARIRHHPQIPVAGRPPGGATKTLENYGSDDPPVICFSPRDFFQMMGPEL